MSETLELEADLPRARSWPARLSRYRGANLGRSLWELAVTVIPFAVLWLAAAAALSVSPLLAALLIVPTAGFLVRLFMIQHDCGHGTFFRKRATNDWLGRVLGIFTFTPYDVWARSHAVHHATTGNLDHRGTGDIRTLTVREYQDLTALQRVLYQAYRHPLVLFGIGPAFLFLLQHRLPFGYFREGSRYWLSAMITNAGIAGLIAAIVWFGGWNVLLFVHLPVVVVAATIGVWLFYVQHQFEDTYWRESGNWDVHDAALAGSSYYDLPRALQWMTANIGMHHIHHLCSRIPFYRLPEIIRDHPELRDVHTVNLLESFKCTRLKLWDEDLERLVGLSAARR